MNHQNQAKNEYTPYQDFQDNSANDVQGNSDNSDTASLASRVKLIRKHYALSQHQFAKRIGRTKGYISNVENGHAGMSKATIISVAAEFGVSEDWLRSGLGEMFASSSSTDERERTAVDTVDQMTRMPVNTLAIARRIREVRKSAGLTQSEFASTLGYTKDQISRIETGNVRPSVRLLGAVSREYKVSVDWLRTGDAGKLDPVDDRLIAWLREYPEIARELRVIAGLDE